MLKVFVGTRYFIYSDEVWIVAETQAVAEKKLQDLEVSEVWGGGNGLNVDDARITDEQYITQVKLEALDQFHLVPANLVTPGDETGTLSYVYYLDELTMPKWWQLLRYVRQKKFEHIILRSQLTILKRLACL